MKGLCGGYCSQLCEMAEGNNTPSSSPLNTSCILRWPANLQMWRSGSWLFIYREHQEWTLLYCTRAFLSVGVASGAANLLEKAFRLTSTFLARGCSARVFATEMVDLNFWNPYYTTCAYLIHWSVPSRKCCTLLSVVSALSACPHLQSTLLPTRASFLWMSSRYPLYHEYFSA